MNRILFQETVQIGDKWFRRHEQYAYTGTIDKEVECNDCNVNHKYRTMKHYQIDFDGVVYDIPFYTVVEWNEDFPPEYVDKIRYLENKYSDNIFDYVKEVKKLLGIDITYKADTSINYLRFIEKEKEFFRRTNAIKRKNYEDRLSE